MNRQRYTGWHTGIETPDQATGLAARVGKTEDRRVAEPIAVIGTARAVAKLPGASAGAHTKDQSGKGGVPVFTDGQGGDGERGELLCRHFGGPQFGLNLGSRCPSYP